MTATHTPVLHTASDFPPAEAAVAKEFDKDSRQRQREQADALYSFLTDFPDLLRLNEGDHAYAALLSVAKTKFVKVVFCPGFGSSPIGSSASATDGKLLFLQGDGDAECGPPSPLCISKVAADAHTVAAMTVDQFSTTIATKGADFSYPLLSRTAVSSTVAIMTLAPLPPYLVYDGFDRDLNAAEVLERVLSNTEASGDMFDHLQDFLRACLTAHGVGDNKPYLPSATLTCAPPRAARHWAKNKFTKCFPTLAAAPTPVVPVAQGLPTGQALLDLISAIRGASATAPTTAAAPPTQDKEDKFMSKSELAMTCRMCGQPDTGSLADLPAYFSECAAANTSDNYKMLVIRKWIMGNVFYDDADVPLTSSLLKMVIKRAWTGKDGNVTRPSLVHAMEGLSPFLMLDMSEDEVAQLNDEEDLIASASNVSVADLRSQRKQKQISVPVEPEAFLLMLKRYANFLFAIFSDTCPLFLLVKEVIRALRDFSREARRRMTIGTKGSILWIILLQSRHFALGELSVLCEFSTMHSDLQAKRAVIQHGECPAELLANSSSTPGDTLADPPENNEGAAPPPEKPPKKPRKANPNTWHPKLKAALEGPLKEAGEPSFTKILNFCKTNAYHIVPKTSQSCAPNMLFGRCFHGDKCTRKHDLANDTQVEQILEITAPFRADPKNLTTG